MESVFRGPRIPNFGDRPSSPGGCPPTASGLTLAVEVAAGVRHQVVTRAAPERVGDGRCLHHPGRFRARELVGGVGGSEVIAGRPSARLPAPRSRGIPPGARVLQRPRDRTSCTKVGWSERAVPCRGGPETAGSIPRRSLLSRETATVVLDDPSSGIGGQGAARRLRLFYVGLWKPRSGPAGSHLSPSTSQRISRLQKGPSARGSHTARVPWPGGMSVTMKPRQPKVGHGQVKIASTRAPYHVPGPCRPKVMRLPEMKSGLI